jgi:hypothetical protein
MILFHRDQPNFIPLRRGICAALGPTSSVASTTLLSHSFLLYHPSHLILHTTMIARTATLFLVLALALAITAPMANAAEVQSG